MQNSFTLNRQDSTPLYTQLKKLLIIRIEQGEFSLKKLPTIRNTAGEYQVSINTVLRAYEALQNEGYVTGTVGRGTFVSTTKEEMQEQNRDFQLRNVIRHALEEALSSGHTIDDFEQEVKKYINKKRDDLSRVTIVFIECNIEQLRYFTDHLELESTIKRVPVLLSDLQTNKKDAMKKIQACDLVLTSFYHVSEVTGYLGGLNKPVIGINLEPEISTIVDIAKIPADSTVGIVTTSKKFLNIIKEVLQSLNLHFASILETNSQDEESIMRLVSQCGTVLVSPKQKQVVSRYAKNKTRVIEFVFTPDRTSINNIKVAIMDLKTS
jgi:GntR family transcriptional regulator